jgi:hypothetical protein
VIIALEVLFILTVTADTILTYKIINSGKGTEIGPIAKYYIGSKAAAIVITIVAVAFLIGWLRLVNMTWMLIPCILRMAWLCRKHVRILNG